MLLAVMCRVRRAMKSGSNTGVKPGGYDREYDTTIPYHWQSRAFCISRPPCNEHFGCEPQAYRGCKTNPPSEVISTKIACYTAGAHAVVSEKLLSRCRKGALYKLNVQPDELTLGLDTAKNIISN